MLYNEGYSDITLKRAMRILENNEPYTIGTELGELTQSCIVAKV